MRPGRILAGVVAASGRRSVARVWLFKGAGGRGAVSDEALRTAEGLGMEVVAGACPLMFLEPVRGVHRVHRFMRRRRHTRVRPA